MVVLVIDQDGIGSVEAERQTPVAAHARRVMAVQPSGQAVKAPARHVHVERPARSVETCELAP
ncbi:hypothetical protein WT97_05060 [Burkholderia sp. MSMB1459WGS]|nr:hypothetical protein WM24_16000 [Burkholderia ubonensis]KWO48892.1 hypothetical protein WT97_05060 [Burkholderia sp. MSMB1459WGS]